jgi:hypothetical protein
MNRFLSRIFGSPFVTVGYVILAIGLLLYSYTQVDLNLTLSRASVVADVQKAFQYIGFYNRGLSTALYLVIVVGLFGLYGKAIAHARSGALSTAHVWRIIFVVMGVLFFSYPAAFSYDFFNYMFTAKTVLVYHKNPYEVIPLQFAGIDPWTNFMRWTHLPSAYTPLWIGISLIPFALGFGYFLLVLFGIKALIAGCFLLACWALSKTLGETNKKLVSQGLVLFALNPLIIIETLVSAHNDIVMIAFVLMALAAYYKKEITHAWMYLSLSIAAKLMTIMLVPLFVLRKKNAMWMLIAMLAGLAVVIVRREILPWYWVWIVPFVALVPAQRYVTILSGFVSFGLLLMYVPYLFTGAYEPQAVAIASRVPWVMLGLGIVYTLVLQTFRKR